jgi:hypothetical protein
MRTAEPPVTKSMIETKENANYWNYWIGDDTVIRMCTGLFALPS